jgi:hypothetical protein
VHIDGCLPMREFRSDENWPGFVAEILRFVGPQSNERPKIQSSRDHILVEIEHGKAIGWIPPTTDGCRKR